MTEWLQIEALTTYTLIMTLTVSMEDMELFPKDSRLNTKPQSVHIDLPTFTQMHASLDRLWWSRLVISFVADLDAVVTYPLINETLLALSSSRQTQNPFFDKQVESSFTRVFGQPNDATYRVANG
ncbi:unnamed protein product [Strongylus vulgaris]|uniref:DUF8117 domain-containing protein n=1 Tax=Strongylus vulgaris TaxID=40348 RepID=A0A3P7JYN4_STRVU|nr:unnamed protein product [Strongylus vulgaris]